MIKLRRLLIVGVLAGVLASALSACATPERQSVVQDSDQAPPPDAVPVATVVRIQQSSYGDCIDEAVLINARTGTVPGAINYFPMRLIPPNSGMTHDRVVERLNVYVNNDGNIIAANCG